MPRFSVADARACNISRTNVVSLPATGCDVRGRKRVARPGDYPPPRAASKKIRMFQIRNVPPAELPLDLLLLADPSEQRIRRYLGGAHTFVGVKDAVTVSVLVLRLHDAARAEIMNISVAEACQRAGIGRAMLEFAATYAKERGALRLDVGTGNSSFGELRFYQRLGFRVTDVSPDYFVDYHPPIVEEGVRCLDMIHLTRAL
ncbi:MAG TPA: GNAT family N-acetyltransferase [Rudaea sp.]|nr:GNAT family N-acetyltransferase [Rudaea sp.]